MYGHSEVAADLLCVRVACWIVNTVKKTELVQLTVHRNFPVSCFCSQKCCYPLSLGEKAVVPAISPEQFLVSKVFGF